MNRIGNRRGFTVTELIVVTCLITAMGMVMAPFFTKNVTFFRRAQARQNLTRDARVCLSTIVQFLRAGRASTLEISTPTSLPLVPNSQVRFTLHAPLSSGATSLSIYLEEGVVYMRESMPSGASQTARALAKNVNSLMFTGDGRDPSVVGVTLRMESAQGTGTPGAQVSHVQLPMQVVHMSETL